VLQEKRSEMERKIEKEEQRNKEKYTARDRE
jgi:hypothetical protein